MAVIKPDPLISLCEHLNRDGYAAGIISVQGQPAGLLLRGHWAIFRLRNRPTRYVVVHEVNGEIGEPQGSFNLDYAIKVALDQP